MADEPESIEAIRARMAATNRPALIEPGIYARVFEEYRDGAQILEELTLRFARPAKLVGGIDAVLSTYHSAGARSVIEFIVNRINQAHGVPTNDDNDQ